MQKRILLNLFILFQSIFFNPPLKEDLSLEEFKESIENDDIIDFKNKNKQIYYYYSDDDYLKKLKEIISSLEFDRNFFKKFKNRKSFLEFLKRISFNLEDFNFQFACEYFGYLICFQNTQFIKNLMEFIKNPLSVKPKKYFDFKKSVFILDEQDIKALKNKRNDEEIIEKLEKIRTFGGIICLLLDREINDFKERSLIFVKYDAKKRSICIKDIYIKDYLNFCIENSEPNATSVKNNIATMIIFLSYLFSLI